MMSEANLILMEAVATQPRVVDEGVRRLVRAAQDARDHAITFTSSVGIAYETYDGKIFTGFNIQTHGRKMDRHAEEVGLDSGMKESYIGTDYKRMVEIFQDMRNSTPQIFPACTTCWDYQKEFTHPYLELIVATPTGEVVQSNRLKDIFALPWVQMYPNNFIRKLKQRRNSVPRLPLADELRKFCETDPYFNEFCDDLFSKGL
jgi:cytidine deaminase